MSEAIQAAEQAATQEATQETQPVVETAKPNPATVELDYKGEKRLVTFDELKVLGQKGLASGEEFRQAKAYRDETLDQQADLKPDADMGKLIRVAQDEGADPKERILAARDLFMASGHDEASANELVRKLVEKGQSSAQGNGQATSQATGQKDEIINQLVAAQRETNTRLRGYEAQIQNLDQANLEKVEQETKTEVRQAVEGDEVLKKLVRKAGPRADQIHKKVWDTVLRRAQESKHYSGQTVQESLQETRQWADELGLLSSANAIPAALSGFAPGGFDAALHLSDEPIEPKSMTDGGYDDNVAARIQAEILKRMSEAS